MPLIGSINIQWPYIVYFALYLLIVPIYLTILVVLIKLRSSNGAFKTTFYAILVQNSIADILALSVYGAEKVMGFVAPEVLQEYQGKLLAIGFYYTIFWFIVIRTHGVVFLSIHRYLLIVQPHHYFVKRIQSVSSLTIFLIFWIPPLAVNLVLFSDTRIKYILVNGLLQTIPESSDVTNKNTNIMMTLLIVLCMISILCYVLIGRMIRKNSDSMSRSMRRELRLALQVFILVAAQIMILLFFASVNIFTAYGLNDELVFLKSLTPYVYGLPSYCSPFTILFFNRELTKRIKTYLVGEREETQRNSSMVGGGSGVFVAMGTVRTGKENQNQK